MSTEVMYTLEEDKQETRKQLGCMNGIFQLFDRRYLLGQRRASNHHKKPPQGQTVTTNIFINPSYKLKDQGPSKVMKETHRESVESSRGSFSSSCSSLDYCKPVQTEPSSFFPSMFTEPSSPTSNKKHDLWVAPTDIRDVVKDSMSRKPRVVLVKTVAKDKQNGPKMTHADSPRPLQQHPKPITYERKDQNLVKLKETSIPVFIGVKDVKHTSRFSYDERESSYKLKSDANIKDHPRLSLDSKQSSMKHNANVVDQSQTHEPKGNKRPPSSVVARLMGLDVLNCDPLKIKALKVNALTRIPEEPAPRKQEVKQPVNKKVKQRADHACQSLKHTLEAMQGTKMKLENTQSHKSFIKPANLTSDSMLITSLQKVNPGRGHRRNLTPTETKEIGRSKKQPSPSHTTDSLTAVSPRHQRSKIRKQSNGHPPVSNSKTRDRSCRHTFHIRNLSEQSDASVASQNEPEVDSKDTTRVYKNKVSETLMGNNPMVEQPSPVSVLDAIYTEDTPSPIKMKLHAYRDDDEQEWSQVGTDELISNTEPDQLTSGANDIKFHNIKKLIHQTELSHEGMNEDHIYIKEMLSASGFLKNLDSTTTIVHLHPTGSLINPELFNILESTKKRTSKSDKIKRKLIFDTVNNILVQKIWTSKRKGRSIDGQKLLEELCLEINNLHTNKARDEYGEIINIIIEDANYKSGDWDDYCNEVPALVSDIERFIFNNLVTELDHEFHSVGPTIRAQVNSTKQD